MKESIKAIIINLVASFLSSIIYVALFIAIMTGYHYIQDTLPSFYTDDNSVMVGAFWVVIFVLQALDE